MSEAYEGFFSRRELKRGQSSSMEVVDVATGVRREVYTTDRTVVDGPNWAASGDLVFNADRQLFAVPAEGGRPRLLDTGGRTDLNHDHALTADGTTLYFTTNDGDFYRLSLDGADAPRLISRRTPDLACRYIHGVSPDGCTLLFVGGQETGWLGAYDIYSFGLDDGVTTQLTNAPGRHDGGEFSPDGEWIYFNSERASTLPGHNQLFRMRPDGSEVRQLTFDERVNWFPHPSPDGNRLAYLSYEPLTNGHPFNHVVELVFTDPTASEVEARLEVFGGNGTANENGWSPDSSQFAFVEYPWGGPRG